MSKTNKQKSIDVAVEALTGQPVLKNDHIMNWLKDRHQNKGITYDDINAELDNLVDDQKLQKYYCFTPTQMMNLQTSGQGEASIIFQYI